MDLQQMRLNCFVNGAELCSSPALIAWFVVLDLSLSELLLGSQIIAKPFGRNIWYTTWYIILYLVNNVMFSLAMLQLLTHWSLGGLN